MNIPFLTVALLLAAAFFAHLIVGTRETLSLRTNGEEDRCNWIQALCVFRLVSVDLFLTAAAAYLLACTQMAGARWKIAYFIATYLGVWSVVWLVQLKVTGCGGRNYYLLGQWIMFFLCSGLMAWGTQALRSDLPCRLCLSRAYLETERKSMKALIAEALHPFELTVRYINADYQPAFALRTIDSNAGYDEAAAGPVAHGAEDYLAHLDTYYQ